MYLIVIFTAVCITVVNSYVIIPDLARHGRPVYAYEDAIESIYSTPGKDIKLTCRRSNDNQSLSWYTIGFTIHGYTRELFRVYLDYNPTVVKTQINDDLYELAIYNATRKRHDFTYLCVDRDTAIAQKIVTINILESPFNNGEIIHRRMRDNNVLTCGVDIGDERWQYYRWVYFPMEGNMDVYEPISDNELLLGDNRFNFTINDCNLHVNATKYGLYVFTATYLHPSQRSKLYYVKTYRLTM